MIRISAFIALILAFAAGASGADWPLDRADAARSGYTPEQLSTSISLRWTAHESLPTPAWPTIERMPFDRAEHVVAADGKLFYGTSSDNRVVARDASTGAIRWSFFCDAPVRFAPAIWRDRLFVASDDGFFYCLAVADGRLLWKLRGGPRADMLLGNDRMISRWPVRGAPAVVDGVVYFAAGIWPTEGVSLRAVDALTGRELWRNDSAGSIEMNQPHPTARAKSGVAAQGALAVLGDMLLVPTGRAVPAVFDRADGKFRYFQLSANRNAGGSEVLGFDRFFINGGTVFTASNGGVQEVLGVDGGKQYRTMWHGYIEAIQVAIHPRWLVYASGNRLRAVDRSRLLAERESSSQTKSKKAARAVNQPVWSTELPAGPVASLVIAGDCIVTGGKDEVTAFDIKNGQVRWRGKVAGTAYSLAVADGRLLASTDRGTIHCFAGGDSPSVELPALSASTTTAENPIYAKAAEEIVRQSGVSEGYCLDWNCGDGRLALELARQTKLRIYAVDADPAKVAAAREMLTATGLYGARVTVHQADLALAAYPNYFADLIVSGRSTTAETGVTLSPLRTIARMQRPCGGVICVGAPGAMRKSVRGPLEGAGNWTHLYAGPANTVCSEDARLRGPLGMLWFRDTDLTMATRHGRAPSPLVDEHRMFVEGIDAVRAVNIYNGSTLWEVPLHGVTASYHQDHLTGVAATGSNMCIGLGRLYLHTGTDCLSLDVKTGRQLSSWKAPAGPDGKPGRWGYLAYQDGLLFGSLANEKHVVKESLHTFLGKLDMSAQLSESSTFFAIDGASGAPQWKFIPEHSIRHNTIAIGHGRVYLIDRPVATMDTPWSKAGKGKPAQPTGRLVCLDARSGKLLWENRNEIFGTLLALSDKHDALLMSYQPTSFQLESEVGGRLAAYRASDGARLWDEKARYKSRPILNEGAVYAEPGKWDLLTGKPLPFDFSRSYGCGILAASKRLLVYRSATLGYYDLEGSRKTENFGGIRPGCWINTIPAGGLVLMADAASWCTCSYLNQATIALEPVSQKTP